MQAMENGAGKMANQPQWAAWLCIALAICPAGVFAGVGTWKNYTSMTNVRCVARSGNSYWAATDGGLFSWKENSVDFQTITNAEGLRSSDLTAVGIDAQGDVWAGSSTGLLHVYSPLDGSIRILFDISVANETNKRINSFAMVGDTVFICTNFGLSVFNIDRFEFGDTYKKFGSATAGVKFGVLSAAVRNGRLYAALSDSSTTNRIASAQIGDPNILAPSAWTTAVAGGLTAIPGTLAVFGGTLYVGTSAGVYVLADTGWTAVASMAGKSVNAMAAGSTALFACVNGNEVDQVSTANSTVFGTSLPATGTAIALSSSGSPVVGTAGAGLVTFGTSWTSHHPNGPSSNQFQNVAVDPDGIVWAASGGENGQGLYRFDGRSWKVFTTQNSPLPINDVYLISVGCNGTVWASTYGGGLVEIPHGTDTIQSQYVFSQNVGLVGLSSNNAFVVPGNVVCDSYGNSWVDIDQAADNRGLTVERPDGSWVRLPAVYQGSKLDLLGPNPKFADRCFALDGGDNLWSAARDNNGVVSFSNQGALDSLVTVHLDVNSGLPSNTVNTIVADKDGSIWVGTDQGIAIIVDPLDPLNPGSIAAYKPLLGVTINSIAVDPLNQKWIGTAEGAILLSPDGTSEVASYTAESTDGKLISNDILSIAVDARSGTVYFGTTAGLASLSTAAAAPKTGFSGLTVYPNPYRIPNAVPLTVDGLVESSSLKILTYDGRLVRELSTPGGRLGFWDGKDASGQIVPSGIYFVVAYSEDGTQVTTGKIAVLRK